MPGLSGPLTPRRKLAAELRRLREESGRTLEDVAEELLISTSKMSRLEKAQGSPQPRDVRDLIRFYGLEGTTLATDMTRWMTAARRQAWWSSYTDVFRGRTSGFDTHVAYETEATSARIYAIPVLPVLLQTPDYIRAFYKAAEHWRSDEQVEQLVDLRLRRQEVLARRDPTPLNLILVLNEACLRQIVGSTAIMRAQMKALVERASAPNIDLRILPFSAPPAYTAGCMYAYFTFEGDTDRDVVSIETHAGFRYIESGNQVEEYRQHFQDLQDRSLTPGESRDLIRAAARSYE
jgi:transcriptional regulator with XRE-family HTH domain